ncbi:MAG: hypothetical protein L6R40_001891 [Gallowayella cf. fulva]|nr:MAG: hypothetical protein L6R40_001891 [Xanthomendoza cf. fulva]
MARRTRKSSSIHKAASVGQFICSICHRGFSRRCTVKDPHFGNCVRKSGNPDNLLWDSHPTCWIRRGDGTRGPSGTFPPSQKSKEQKDEATGPRDPATSTADNTSNRRHKPSTALATLLGNKNLADPSRYALVRQIEQHKETGVPSYLPHDHASIAQVRLLSSMKSHRLLLTTTQDSQTSHPFLLPNPNNAMEPSTPHQLPSLQSLQLPSVPLRISSLKVNQVASAVIGMSREQAGESDGKALYMWNVWMSLKPVRVTSTIQQPKPGASQKDRQQAITWFAQDVFKGRFLQDAEGPLSAQIRYLTQFRDLAITLEGEEGVKKIHNILLPELGDVGLELLLPRKRSVDIFLGTGSST